MSSFGENDKKTIEQRNFSNGDIEDDVAGQQVTSSRSHKCMKNETNYINSVTFKSDVEVQFQFSMQVFLLLDYPNPWPQSMRKAFHLITGYNLDLDNSSILMGTTGRTTAPDAPVHKFGEVKLLPKESEGKRVQYFAADDWKELCLVETAFEESYIGFESGDIRVSQLEKTTNNPGQWYQHDPKKDHDPTKAQV